MEDISLLGGGVFGDLDDIFGILYGDYTIWDDYLVFELIYFVFLFVHLVCMDYKKSSVFFSKFFFWPNIHILIKVHKNWYFLS